MDCFTIFVAKDKMCGYYPQAPDVLYIYSRGLIFYTLVDGPASQEFVRTRGESDYKFTVVVSPVEEEIRAAIKKDFDLQFAFPLRK